MHCPPASNFNRSKLQAQDRIPNNMMRKGGDITACRSTMSRLAKSTAGKTTGGRPTPSKSAALCTYSKGVSESAARTLPKNNPKLLTNLTGNCLGPNTTGRQEAPLPSNHGWMHPAPLAPYLSQLENFTSHSYRCPKTCGQGRKGCVARPLSTCAGRGESTDSAPHSEAIFFSPRNAWELSRLPVAAA